LKNFEDPGIILCTTNVQKLPFPNTRPTTKRQELQEHSYNKNINSEHIKIASHQASLLCLAPDQEHTATSYFGFTVGAEGFTLGALGMKLGFTLGAMLGLRLLGALLGL